MKPRIILDTSVVRKHLHQDSDRIDLILLRTAKQTMLVSLSDVTMVELLHDLLSEAIKWDKWVQIGELNAVLDEDLPVLPGGHDLGVMARLYDDSQFIEGDCKIFYRECWLLLANARSRSDMDQPRRYKDSKGSHQLRANQTHVDNMFEEIRKSWSGFIREIQQNPSVRGKNHKVIALMVDAGTEPEDGEADDLQEKLEAQRKLLIHYIANAVKTRNSYNPDSDKNKNDLLDLHMLFALVLDNTIICTADTRSIINPLKSIGSTQAKRVITPVELNKRLTAGTLRDLFKP